MFVKLACSALHGVDAFRVDLEVDLFRKGLPAFSMVGLAEASVRESKERVFSALKNCGHKIPPSRITVNLAPADQKKQGSAYDLPLALGLLGAAGIIAPEKLDGFFVSGELSLAGEARPVPGVLSMAILAKNEGARGVIVPAGSAAEAAAVEGLTVYGVNNLGEALAALAGDFSAYSKAEHEQHLADCEAMAGFVPGGQLDFAEVKGQEHAKRAIEIAAAGGHNLLFVGPPGSGKTMLAQRIPSILPELRFEEALEVSKIYSVAGLLQWGMAQNVGQSGLIAARPFRAPHHTISYAGLAGGGAYPKPGEVSLAHRGVLFLDELPEFSRSVLEVLRQPLEGGEVNISRAGGAISYPARFMLVAAMNPCPCGYLNDAAHTCSCTGNQVQNYRARLSGPLLDRIDLHIEVPAVPYKELRTPLPGMSSKEMRERIIKVRNIQAARYQNSFAQLAKNKEVANTLAPNKSIQQAAGEGAAFGGAEGFGNAASGFASPGASAPRTTKPNGYEPLSMTNADLSGKYLAEFCALGQAEHDFLEQAANALGLSARSCTRILRISRTIADLAGEEMIGVEHLAEATNCRFLDRPI